MGTAEHNMSHFLITTNADITHSKHTMCTSFMPNPSEGSINCTTSTQSTVLSSAGAEAFLRCLSRVCSSECWFPGPRSRGESSLLQHREHEPNPT
eukprot:6282060-Amphidinium_carterae.2